MSRSPEPTPGPSIARHPPDTRGPFAATADSVRVRLVVSPGARAERVGPLRREADGGTALRVAVTVPPENGRANAAVIALLARAWGLPKSALTVVSGHADRRKTVAVAGEPEPLLSRLWAWAAAHGGKA